MSKKHHNNPDPVFDDTGPSSSQTPYLVPAQAGVQIESILSVGDQVGVKEAPAALAGQPWRMVGIPDGLGAFDNGDGTMTVLMNYELGATAGVVREHGSTGAFVSALTVDTTTHQVLDATDLSQDVFLFNRTTNVYEETTTQFGRLCSADLPAVSAFYDAATGLGTTERIFMDGEEIGNEGRAFAHIVTGPEAGNSYELPALGRMSWENSPANAYSGVEDHRHVPGRLHAWRGVRLYRREAGYRHRGGKGRPHQRQAVRNFRFLRRRYRSGRAHGHVPAGRAGQQRRRHPYDRDRAAGPERTAHAIRSSRGRRLGSEQSQPLLFHHHRDAHAADPAVGNGLHRHRAPRAGRHDQGPGRRRILQFRPEQRAPADDGQHDGHRVGPRDHAGGSRQQSPPRQGVDVRPGGRQRCRPDERPYRDRAPRPGALHGRAQYAGARRHVQRGRGIPPAWSMSPA